MILYNTIDSIISNFTSRNSITSRTNSSSERQYPSIFSVESVTIYPTVNSNRYNIINEEEYPLSRLSQCEIENSTELLSYNQSMTEIRCPISFDNFIIDEEICRIRGCQHIFKRTSLMNWLKNNINCPICRFDLMINQPQSSNLSEEYVDYNQNYTDNEDNENEDNENEDDENEDDENEDDENEDNENDNNENDEKNILLIDVVAINNDYFTNKNSDSDSDSDSNYHDDDDSLMTIHLIIIIQIKRVIILFNNLSNICYSVMCKFSETLKI